MTGARFKSWKDRLLDLSSTTGNRLLSLEKKAPTERVAHELAPIFGAVLNMFSEKAAHAAAEQKEEASDRLIALSRLLDNAAHKVSGLPNLLISKRFIASSQHSFLAYADGMREFLGDSVVNDVCKAIASNDNLLHAVYSKIKDEISEHEEDSLYVQINEEFLENLEDLLSNDQPFILAPSRASVDPTGGVLTSMEDLQKGFLRVTSSLGNPWSVPPKWHYDLSKLLAREARSAEEETGFSPLYLALGCLQWREDAWQSEDGAELMHDGRKRG